MARRRQIDQSRRGRNHQTASAQISLLNDELAIAPLTDIPDHRLALMLACAHPAIESTIRAPLMLQTVLGLDASRIAGAFLTSPSAMGKRLGRAKARIRQSDIGFSIPDQSALPDRMAAVLDAVYAAFTEGWSDPGGSDAQRRDLTSEALFLARLVAQLAPDHAEALGLLALILHAHARQGARRAPDGTFVPLADQDVNLWDDDLIAEAEALLLRASTLGQIDRFQLEAALQSAHAHHRRSGINNRAQIVQLYDALAAAAGSPVVAINRALAVAALYGPAAGLAALPQIDDDPQLTQYQPYWAAKAELLATNGAILQTRHAYRIAMGLERDDAVRAFLARREADLESPRAIE